MWSGTSPASTTTTRGCACRSRARTRPSPWSAPPGTRHHRCTGLPLHRDRLLRASVRTDPPGRAAAGRRARELHRELGDDDATGQRQMGQLPGPLARSPYRHGYLRGHDLAAIQRAVMVGRAVPGSVDRRCEVVRSAAHHAEGRYYISFRRASPATSATLRLAPFMVGAEQVEAAPLNGRTWQRDEFNCGAQCAVRRGSGAPPPARPAPEFRRRRIDQLRQKIAGRHALI